MFSTSLNIFLIVFLLVSLFLALRQSTFSSTALLGREPQRLPCQDAQFKFCNVSLPLETRVSSLLSLLTPKEKISLLGNKAAAVPRLGLPEFEFWNEASHGVAFYGDWPHTKVESTSFPQVCSLGVSFNASLFAAVGDAIGTEAEQHFWIARDVPGLTFFTPNINIFRDPRWGRGQEVPGEDPFLNREYASNYVAALQIKDGRERVAATCKHLFAYSMEEGRFTFDAIVDDRDLNDSYLVAFEKCVKSAGAMGIMCSYNKVNGVPACAHGDMLQDTLRGEWGFTGYVVGDCGAVENLYKTQNYAATPEEAVRIALEAGVDLDCGKWIQRYGLDALESGILAIAHVDRAPSNLLRIQFRLGYYDPPPALNVTTSGFNDLSLDASRQSIVLLKNNLVSERPRLPLNQEQDKIIALFGPNADATTTMQGNYAGIAPFLVSPKQGLEDMGIDVSYEKGSNILSSLPMTPDDVDRMCTTAKEADAVVLVVGLDQSVESESRDRTTLALPTAQQQLITDIAACSRQPVVLVVMAGGPVDMTSYRDNPYIGAILYVGYPGQSGGTAIAEALYGKFSPSGRLTTTIYPDSYTERVAMEDMRMRPGSNEFPGRTYRFYTGTVVYPFGFGLSYTQFHYDVAFNDMAVLVQVRNSGSMDGADSVLLFHEGPQAGVEGNPIKSLVGFDKIFLKTGEIGSVEFAVESHLKGSFARFYVGPTRDYCVHVVGRDLKVQRSEYQTLDERCKLYVLPI